MPAKKDGPRTPSGQLSRATGRPKGGRKPRAGVTASEALRLRVTPGELAAVEAAAEAAGLSVAAWLRRAVEEALRHADHARQIAAHLEAVGGMPGATP